METSLPLVSNDPLPGVLDTPKGQLRDWLAQRGQPPMRIKQIHRWLLEGRAEQFEQMSDLPKGLRNELDSSFRAFATRVESHLQSSDATHKLLLRLPDDGMIECVLIQEEPRRTACISTQVGCGMGCVFCASGMDGLARNLTAGEILEQLIRLRNLTRDGERLTNIVVMGMGEPLANLDHLLEALEIAGDPNGLGIGARHITISTVGLPAKMRRLAESGKQYHLAVSLHAPNDRLRSAIVPTNAQTGLASIIEAADEFFAKTGRQVTYEYVLLGELNDSAHQARELASLLQGKKAHINLIPFNDVEGLPYRRPTTEAAEEFVSILRQSGLSVKVRKRKGSEIDAACGQLRRQMTKAQSEPSTSTS